VDFHFEAISPASMKLRLCCRIECSLQGIVSALVRGITIGEVKVSRTFEVGELLEIPVREFPEIDLPATVRFDLGDAELSEPLVVGSREDALLISGHAGVVVKDLCLDGGMLKGVFVGGGAGSAVQNAYVRINGSIMRSLDVEQPRSRAEGGFLARFIVALRPGDLTEVGLSIEIFLPGSSAPIGNFAYTRTDPTAELLRIVALEEAVRQADKSMTLQLMMLGDNFERRLALQQERIDAFIEHVISIVLDHAAGSSEVTDPATFLETLRSVKLELATSARAVSNAQLVSFASVSLDSAAFAFGWYDMEKNEKGQYRWMAKSGLIRNPHPTRPITRIEIDVIQVYGAHTPMLRASLGDFELKVSVEQSQSVFLVVLSPRTESSVTGDTLSLGSFASGSPASDIGTSDYRTLSISAAEVRFHYATSVKNESAS
jgi:hypothetical protein